MQELLRDVPLHSGRAIQELFTEHGEIVLPKEIEGHCDHNKCKGVRRHILGGRCTYLAEEGLYYSFARYGCVNCTESAKVFGLMAQREGEEDSGVCTKIYEEPPFGFPLPKRLFHVIGEANREHFLQARRAIARSLGIGAFAYYRRIVENTKLDLVSSVLEVARATSAPPGQIDLLQKAQMERQFSKAMKMLCDVSAVPAVLLIDGQNPLALLHKSLSEGIHELDDRECLKRAQEAEVILCEIAERLQIAVTDRKAVKAAVASIMNRETTGETGSAAP